jgi:hypothetical protein
VNIVVRSEMLDSLKNRAFSFIWKSLGILAMSPLLNLFYKVYAMIYDWNFLIHPYAMVGKRVYPLIRARCHDHHDRRGFSARLSLTPHQAARNSYPDVCKIEVTTHSLLQLEHDKWLKDGYQPLHSLTLTALQDYECDRTTDNSGDWLVPEVIATFFQSCAIHLASRSRARKQIDPLAMLDAITTQICVAKDPLSLKNISKTIESLRDEIFRSMAGYAHLRDTDFKGWYDPSQDRLDGPTSTPVAEFPFKLTNLPTAKICPIW